jgi:biopolymer transport protein ExbD
MTIIPSPRSKKHARIEIIPLIDIMFFLLATFVMVSLSMVKSHGIPVRLPATSSGQAQEQKDFTTISVTASGQVYLNKEEIRVADLGKRLGELRAGNEELKVFINGDEDARLGLAMEVLDAARLQGITRIGFETRSKSAKDQP